MTVCRKAVDTRQSELPWSYCPLAETANGNNDSVSRLVEECEKSSETQYFWYRTALDISGNIGEDKKIKKK